MEKKLKALKSVKLTSKVLRFKQSFILMSLVLTFNLFAGASYSQEQKFDLELKNARLEEALKEIIDLSGYQVLYRTSDVSSVKGLNIKFKQATIVEILDKCLENTKLAYKINAKTIVIQPVDTKKPKTALIEIRGRVTDEYGNSLPGATIVVEGTNKGITTDNYGIYKIKVPSTFASIRISYIGFEPQVIAVRDQEYIDVVLSDLATNLSEVIVTGIFVRKASSYTGSTSTMSSKDLKKVANLNVFQALKNLDPTMAILDNVQMGSNPSAMPEIQIRGMSSFSNAGAESFLSSKLKGNYLKDANQPLFIVDGFESSVEQVFDMDMDRIESVTILKDASAKAIYGSKSANGVVVIETKKLLSNETRVTYNSSINIVMPDLTSYNLANSTEKLAAEVIDGMYIPTRNDADRLVVLNQLYNSRKKLIQEGLDTYWISKPLQTGVGNKQSLSVELGSENLKVLADVSYNKVTGTMIGSYRTNISGRLNLSYRVKNLLFKNIMNVNSNNSQDSPYGSFSEYSRMNPYWRSESLDGSIPYYSEIGPNGERYTNPLYNSTLNTNLASSYLNFTNNFYLEWSIIPGLKATTRIGIDIKNSDANEFYPSSHTKFEFTKDEQKGTYQVNNGKSSKLSGDLNVNYSKEVNKHFYFANVGFNMSESSFQEIIHNVEGFPSDQMNNIVFGRAYALNSTPSGIDGISRDIGFLGVFSYMYDNRFLSDITLRSNASSLFGSDKRWANFWSLGLGWNLHNENFLKDGPFQKLKLRSSLGSTGNQNFNTNASIATYSYYLLNQYQGNIGSYLENMANSSLQWESKFEYNIGFDAKIKNLSMKFDYYQSYTQNLITSITIPSSTGFSMVSENIGKVKNTGFEFSTSYMVWSNKNDYVNLSFSMATNKNEIVELSDAMRSFNDAADLQAASRQTSVPVHKYEDGISMNAIWTVPSLGIDPATGQEIYLDKNGNTTFEWSADDMVVSGNSVPDFQGNVSVSGEFKGIGFNVTCRFFGGGQYYNHTLVNKVENVDMNYNVDKRVLTGRWLYPGQIALFKRLGNVSEDLDGDGVLETHYIERTRATSRFVQDYNQFDISAISLYYNFSKPLLRKMNIGLERLKFSVNMNEVAKISSIKVERGLSYPFARTLSFTLSATF